MESKYQGTLVLQANNYHYEIINGTTKERLIGGVDNLAGVNGTSFSAVVQAGEDILENGESIEITPGHYVSDGVVSIKGNTSIFGHGDSTFIQQKANMETHVSLFLITFTENVEISHMWIDGNKANQFDNGDEMRQGIIPHFAENVWVHDMRITNFTETGYDPAWSNNCTIENSILTGSGDGDIWIDVDSKNQIVRNNICNKIFAVDFGGSMTNVLITNNTANFLEIYQGSNGIPHGIIVCNNMIMATGIFAVYTQGCLNVTIKDNVIIGIWGVTDTGLLISSGRNFTITGNIVTNCGSAIKSGTLIPPSNHMITKNDFRGNNIPIIDNTTQTMDFIKYNLGADISELNEIP